MKISYRNNPLIKSLENDNFEFSVSENDKDNYNKIIGFKIFEFIDLNKKIFLNNINIISNPFLEAFEIASPQLYDLLEQENLDTADYCKVLIQKNKTIFYKLIVSDKNINIKILAFDKNILSAYIDISDTETLSFISNDYKVGKEEIINNTVFTTICMELFLIHCPIETINLASSSKIKKDHLKYVNDTNSNVKILTSLWFTNLIQNNEFKVRGHFRLQPYKNGKKLIWIDSFNKKGYNRSADKLKD